MGECHGGEVRAAYLEVGNTLLGQWNSDGDHQLGREETTRSLLEVWCASMWAGGTEEGEERGRRG